MSARSAMTLAAATSVLLAASACGRGDRTSPDRLRSEIRALQAERDVLRPKLDELMARDPRLRGMPDMAVRVGVPTSLIRELIEKVVAGFVDQITLELKDINVNKRGKVKRLVTIGEYDLNVHIDEVRGRLKTGKPEVRFGGNQVRLALPVTVASGRGHATIDFKWDGRNVGDAVCGDMQITREVSGSVRPDTYAVSGGIVLTATANEILAAPKIPKIKVNLKVEPSQESWAAVQAVLDAKTGVCGFVLERVDVLKIVKDIVDRGFNVVLPTEKLRPMAVPVGVEPSMEVRGRRIALGVKLGRLAITENTFWLGADVSVSAAAAPR